MTETELSYASCEQISKRSGSNFYRSFDLLTYDRRRGMNALYAFARLADDASDAPISPASQATIAPSFKTDDDPNRDRSDPHPGINNSSPFVPEHWHTWIDQLYDRSIGDVTAIESPELSTPNRNALLEKPPADGTLVPQLAPIAAAVHDTISRFQIERDCLHDIVRGVAMDETLRLQDWPSLRLYCERVASSVGLACLSIWRGQTDKTTPDWLRSAAIDCGIAFQLTNILRDVVEDIRRGRVYFAEDEMELYGTSRAQWLQYLSSSANAAQSSCLGDWRGLIRMTIERANAFYDRGWIVAMHLPADGRRMFSLMWHTYRELLHRIELEPEQIWKSRVTLSNASKVHLLASHVITPFFARKFDRQNAISSRLNESSHVGPEKTNCDSATIQENNECNEQSPCAFVTKDIAEPTVAVIGGGLAGINAALQLAKHGCKVDLFESKSRLGGRVGSFVDTTSGQSIDYCQHVGMYCCSALRQWIDDVDQSPLWTEQDTLHFIAADGKHIPVRALPLPAPAHLAGLLFRWPQLTWMDRLQIGRAIASLYGTKVTDNFAKLPAKEWLQTQRQSDRCIQNFWATILVSALGEQLDRVTMGPVRKVLIDGFAIHRRAFHLLVPSRPLSELTDHGSRQTLARWGVRVHLNHSVERIETSGAGKHRVSKHTNDFDRVIVATPWQKTAALLTESQSHGGSISGENESFQQVASLAAKLNSSPITGIHTWWDRPWLKQPHAILINRLCQWVFTAPQSPSSTDSTSALPTRTHEHYYQIVISASRDLPKGDSEVVLKAIKRDLAEVFPESAVASLLRAKVVTDPNAVFSVSSGHEESRLASNRLAQHGIWLAGDWTHTEWPATMEGALRSGSIAAQGVLGSLGRAAKLLPDD